MRLTKAKKAYQVRFKKEEDRVRSSTRLYSNVGHIKTSYNTDSEGFKKTMEIVEFDIVEVGVTDGKDFLTRFPNKR
jgi:hypothetical protein